MFSIRLKTCWLLYILFLTIVGCNQKRSDKYQLGTAKLEVTGLNAAKDRFDQGLLLLHSFEYWDAADAFIDAQNIDPEMPMAYWGEAMTYNHALWREQDYKKGVAALQKFGDSKEERRSKIAEGIEKDLFAAVEILYGQGEKLQRDKAYAQFMENLYTKYSGNQEIAAFYAIALLGAVEEGRDDKIYDMGAKVAQGILDENPSHPGALHYLIHSYDDPKNAYKALSAANSYSKVAKDASHALHMPSHIYVALGMWNEVVSSNEASFKASADRARRKQLNSAGSYHALHWLMYGYLQQGRIKEARQIMFDMNGYRTKFPGKGARDYLTAMKGTYLVETNNWLDTIALYHVDCNDLLISTRTVNAFILGMHAFHQGKISILDSIITSIELDRKKALNTIDTRNVSMCGGNWQYEFPNQLDIDQSHVMELELRAMLSWHGRDTLGTKQLFKAATELEEQISYSYGPPVIIKPSHEMYAHWLLEINDSKNAIIQFEKALERAPKRVLSLKGMLEAYHRLGQEDLSRKMASELKTILMGNGENQSSVSEI